ncbi:ribosome-associated heat shock protein Hsp15 [Aestuariibacter salexigens]|uniref:ribosome-associated heat shock protein Hsp15 n=1 Tax=Aestuariibacter salexigens TaxID=226010 RepID=UPI00047EE819|nr:ribosome-associated heat shock protein Hsp15 [Aestuariibacter salexigens]
MTDQKENNSMLSVRLDKWLWAARFFKTRSLARNAIQAGKVSMNGQRCKPGKLVEVGATLRVPQGYDVKEVIVKALSDQRQGAPIAQQLYEETAQSLAQRESNQTARKLSAFHSPRPEHKPDKKQRRELLRIKHQ